MRTFVISDLHLGDRHCRAAAAAVFLEGLPPDGDLVLNGDIMDRNRLKLKPDHQRVLDILRAQSTGRRVIWVRGNHDRTFTLPDPGNIAFVTRHAVGQRLLIMHGHDFENIMPVTRPLLILMCGLHAVRVAMGAEAIHVAHYAKRFPALYRILRHSVMNHAIAYARAHGFAAITCGHTHCVESVVQSGITYYNTGAWTEPVVACVEVTPETVSLVRFAGGVRTVVVPADAGTAHEAAGRVL